MRFIAFVLLMSVSLDAKILVHGHRGARAARPENTLPAFEYAIGLGVDALELDTVVTKDNVLVVSHDPEMNERICTPPAGWKGGTRVIRQMTLAEVQAWDCGAKQNPEFKQQVTVAGTKMPTLDQVLALASKGKFEFNIETKIQPDKPELTPGPAEFAKLLVDAIKKRKLESRVMIQSFDPRTLVEAKKIAPEIRLSALYPTGMMQAALGVDFVKGAKEIGAQIVSPHYRITNKEKVEAAHKAGLQVVPWTANDAGTWDALVAAGVDAIITDDPAGLIGYLKGKGLR